MKIPKSLLTGPLSDKLKGIKCLSFDGRREYLGEEEEFELIHLDAFDVSELEQLYIGNIFLSYDEIGQLFERLKVCKKLQSLKISTFIPFDMIDNLIAVINCNKHLHHLCLSLCDDGVEKVISSVNDNDNYHLHELDLFNSSWVQSRQKDVLDKNKNVWSHLRYVSVLLIYNYKQFGFSKDVVKVIAKLVAKTTKVDISSWDHVKFISWDHLPFF